MLITYWLETKDALKKVVILFCISILSTWIVDSTINFVFRNAKAGIYKKFHDVIIDNSYYDVWILGSSRSETAYETNILSKELNYKFFNAGVEGANYQQVYYFLKWILHHHPAPKWVVVDIDAYAIADTVTKVNLPVLAPFLNVQQIREDFSKIDRSVIYAYYLPMYELPIYGLRGVSKFIRTITGISSPYDTAFQNTGCFHLHLYQKNRYCYIDTTLPKYTDSVAIHPVNRNYLDSIIIACRQKQIPLLLTTSPIYKPDPYIKAAIQIVKEYTTEKNVIYLDFSNISGISSDKENFSDKYHLHFKGSVKFTYHFLDTLRYYIQN